MLPESISRNILFTLIITLLFSALAIVVKQLYVPESATFFIPTSADWIGTIETSFPLIAAIIAFLIIIVTGLIWNRRCVNSEILFKEDYSQVYNYVFIAGSFFVIYPSLSLIISLFLMVLVLDRIFKINKNTDTAYAISFDAGFFLGLAIYFNLVCLVFIPFVWIALIILKSLGFREFLWTMLGITVPFILLYFLRLLLNLNINLLPDQLQSMNSFIFSLEWSSVVLIALSLIGIISGYFALSRFLAKSSVRYKQIIQALSFFFVFFFIFSMVMLGQNGLHTFILYLVFPLSFFWHCVSNSEKFRTLKYLHYYGWLGMLLYAFFVH